MTPRPWPFPVDQLTALRVMRCLETVHDIEQVEQIMQERYGYTAFGAKRAVQDCIKHGVVSVRE